MAAAAAVLLKASGNGGPMVVMKATADYIKQNDLSTAANTCHEGSDL